MMIKRHKQLIIVMTVVINCLICSIPAQAQSVNPNKWRGESYNLTADQSPYDSIRVNKFSLPLLWKDMDESRTQEFLTALLGVYDGTAVSVERVSAEKYLIQRYIINDASEITVLEKHSYPNGIVLYFKNGIAEPELRFYKLLTSYYEE